MKRAFSHPFIMSLVIAPILLGIAALPGGVGHGTYVPAVILFPFAALTVVALDHFFDASIPMMIIAALQFPIYGLLISWARSRSRSVMALAVILTLHALAVLIAIAIVYF
ncbi:MAG TPA: hypothetical protein VK557_20650 [Pyrinomonadaceae bacterium]|nr:hypothetical protein [Pyrinomonadaceae bacterium]